MHIGIDLGTTFCCVAYVDDNGVARVIPNSDREQTTPSVIWFDGKSAYVGKKANQRKLGLTAHIYEFVKRDIGKPVEIPLDFSEPGLETLGVAPYEIDDFKYGAVGMSAIILRKLKRDAIRFFKRIGKIGEKVEEKHIELDAVITVPAYFGDKERQETRLAGIAAGLNVIGIINEPTAAALTYGFSRKNSSKIMVFDLGGGTLDVTLLEMRGDEAIVIASDGVRSLGGRDWDRVIENYIYSEFRRRNEKDIPPDKTFDIQLKALEAKFDLSENEETVVSLSLEEGEMELTLFRSAPKGGRLEAFEIKDTEEERPFYFDERSLDLLGLCKTVCRRVLEKAGMTWGDIDEIVLAGGACRMPMVPDMLEDLSGKRIKRHAEMAKEGFSYDTAIATGAALYGQRRKLVRDVISHGVGVQLMRGERHLVKHLIPKNTPLPARSEQMYRAPSYAMFAIYEGESEEPDECTLRGKIELDNPAGYITVIMEADTNGVLKATADYPPHGKKVIELKNELYTYDQRATPLQNKVQSIVIHT